MAVVGAVALAGCGAGGDGPGLLGGPDRPEIDGPGGPRPIEDIEPLETAVGALDLPDQEDDEGDAVAVEESAAPPPGRPATSTSVPAPPPPVDVTLPPDEEPPPVVAVGAEVDPALDPLSTFGLDVDTAGFTRTRQAIEQGQLPDPAQVRVEDLVNAVEGGYEPPAEPGFAVTVDGAVPDAAAGPDERVVRVGLATRPVTVEDRRDSSLTFVIDGSGSMEGPGKLELVKESLTLLVEALRPTDTVAIVVYSTDARVVLEPTPVAERQRITSAIADLATDGSTNVEAGMRLGYQLAGTMFRPDGINRVVLASDGVANTGSIDPDVILEAIAADADAGIQLVSTGFGFDGFNDPFMERLANAGDGFYAYVDDLREARRLFVEQLPATLEVQAIDARAQVRFDPAVVEGYRLLGYENRAIADEDFRDETVDAGEIGAGHTVTALYAVRLAPGAPPDAVAAAAAVLWVDPTTREVREAAGDVTVGNLAIPLADADPHLQLAATAAAFAEALRASPFATTDLAAVAADAERVATLLPADRTAVELADLTALAAAIA